MLHLKIVFWSSPYNDNLVVETHVKYDKLGFNIREQNVMLLQLKVYIFPIQILTNFTTLFMSKEKNAFLSRYVMAPNFWIHHFFEKQVLKAEINLNRELFHILFVIYLLSDDLTHGIC